VLLWQVNQNASVDNGISDVYHFLVPDTEIGALACVYDANGNFIRNLNLVADPDYADSFVSSRDDLWFMQAIQSYMEDDIAMDALFQIQVGYYDGDFNFISALYSDTETKANLLAGNSYAIGSLYPPGTDWTPGHYHTVNPVVPSVPEPSELMLCIIGLGLLLLKRKNNGES
jgi:hypothetical protein